MHLNMSGTHRDSTVDRCDLYKFYQYYSLTLGHVVNVLHVLIDYMYNRYWQTLDLDQIPN